MSETVRDRVLKALQGAVDEVNQLRADGAHLDLSPETVLVGDGGSLDSLGLVNLLVSAEERLEDEFGRSPSLTDELGADQAAFETVGALVDRVEALVEAMEAA